MESRVPARLSRGEGRRFGLLVGGVFLLLGFVSHWRGHVIAPAVLWTLGGALVLAGALVPGHLGPVHRGWMRLAVLLSKITTPIVMGIIYYGLFTPMGFIRRSLGRNALVRAPGNSFWITRDPGPSRRSDLRRQF